MAAGRKVGRRLLLCAQQEQKFVFSPLHLGRLDLTKPLNHWMPGAVYVG